MVNFELETYPSVDMSKPYKQRNILVSKPVKIMTLHRQDGPIPTVYSEPPKIGIMRRINSVEEDTESGLRVLFRDGYL